MSPARRRLPGLAVLAVLAAAAAVVWAKVLGAQDPLADRVRCPATAGLTPVPHTAPAGVAPLPPGEVAVSVRNATSRHDLAARVAARLRLFGFTENAPPDNDPVYETDALRCHGQIRFGPHGEAAARTVRLVAPCLQLVRDDRDGPAVDVVVGTEFVELSLGPAAREALAALRENAERPDPPAGGLQSATGASAARTPGPALTAPPSARC